MRGVVAISLSLALLLAAAGGIASSAPAIRSNPAVTYQIDQAHRGYQTDDLLTPPLSLRWTRTFPSNVSYPLIARGRVFVTVRNVGHAGTVLHALDQATGETIWSRAISASSSWSGAAYDAGRVFVVNYDGVLQAFAAQTGTTIWTTELPGQWSFSAPPVGSGGVVYTAGAGNDATVYAVSQATGELLWAKTVLGSSHSSPALSRENLYVSYNGPQVYALARSSGNLVWHYDGGSFGGGGRTPVLAPNGRLYVRNPWATGYVFDAQTGELLDTFGSVPAPAFTNRKGLFLYDGALEARSLETDALLWSFRGDGQLSSAPIVVNDAFGHHVYAGSETGMLYALDLADGSVDWSTDVGSPIPRPDEQSSQYPLTGLAAGQGLLVVPAENVLVAYGG